mmetsp:Transcript_70417/g.124343  ORF Transcript_70417/g.124343 Transcript_70417/m.124343 type:complete len:144 (-) Transcript_70417:726-1157(-)
MQLLGRSEMLSQRTARLEAPCAASLGVSGQPRALKFALQSMPTVGIKAVCKQRKILASCRLRRQGIPPDFEHCHHDNALIVISDNFCCSSNLHQIQVEEVALPHHLIISRQETSRSPSPEHARRGQGQGQGAARGKTSTSASS